MLVGFRHVFASSVPHSHIVCLCELFNWEEKVRKRRVKPYPSWYKIDKMGKGKGI